MKVSSFECGRVIVNSWQGRSEKQLVRYIEQVQLQKNLREEEQDNEQ